MNVYLRGSQEFQKVYRQGKRYDSALITAFVLPNNRSHNRLGVTASRKVLGNAVHRNRAKRLLRETFRLTTASLSGLKEKYDWVLNAKAKLVELKVAAATEEFEKLVTRVAREEIKAQN